MRRILLGGTLGAVLVACGLSVTGVAIDNQATMADGGAAPSSATTSSSSTSSSGGGGGASEAGLDAELDNDFVDAGGCVAPIFGATGAAAHSPKGTPDGDLSDWTCASFVRLDRNHAAQPLTNDPQAFVDYALGWDTTGIWFAFRVTDISAPAGNDDGSPWTNDSIELYLGPQSGDGHYVANDLHLIVDYRNEARVYDATNIVGNDAGAENIVTATQVSDRGFTVEGFVPASVVGGTAPHAVMGFDVGLNDRRDDGARAIMWSYLEPVNGKYGSCGDPEPDGAPPFLQTACDTFLWSTIELQP